MPYELRGRFLEACDCGVPCPCWFEQSPDEDECTGLTAWHIEQGTINGFDVSGLIAVSMSQHGGHRDQPEHAHMALVIDESADDGQFIAMREAFSGQLGGPLAELGGLAPEPQLVERAPLAFSAEGASMLLRVGPRVEVQARLLKGPGDEPIRIRNGILSKLLGDPGEAGKASRFRLELPGRKPIEKTDSSTTSGNFSYHHEG
jgi:hypothetical protein